MKKRIDAKAARVAAVVMLLLLAGCSRASLLGGPGPEVAHHASPAEIERLAVIEPGKKFKTADQCHQQLIALAHVGSPDQLVRISDLETRAYHSVGEGSAAVHHEYSCIGKQLMERSWTGKPVLPAHPDEADSAPEVH